MEQQQAPGIAERATTRHIETAVEAISLWKAALVQAADAKAAADGAWAEALLSAHNDEEVSKGLKNDTARKAFADLETVDMFRRAAHAEATAKAAGAMVDLLVGGRR